MTRPAIVIVIVLVTLMLFVTTVYLSSDTSNQTTSENERPAASASAPLSGHGDQTKPIVEYVDVKLKKKRFFEYLLPMITVANAQVLAERGKLLALQKRYNNNPLLSTKDLSQLTVISNKYKMTVHSQAEKNHQQSHIEKLLTRVDLIPVSLVLAQSANESAWGTSRFAVEANNYFGMWCFTPNCGVKPARRTPGLNHEVAKFNSVQEGVSRYVLNLNTNSAYTELRQIRADLRLANTEITGFALAEGLERYSERGDAYVEEIQSMIRFNKLEAFNQISTDQNLPET